jgi:hypothetical protein
MEPPDYSPLCSSNVPGPAVRVDARIVDESIAERTLSRSINDLARLSISPKGFQGPSPFLSSLGRSITMGVDGTSNTAAPRFGLATTAPKRTALLGFDSTEPGWDVRRISLSLSTSLYSFMDRTSRPGQHSFMPAFRSANDRRGPVTGSKTDAEARDAAQQQ